MGLRFRKSIRLGKHARINLSKSGVGYSYGTKGLRWTKKSTGGTRTTTSIPGTGISHVSESSKKKPKRSIWLWILLIAVWPISLCVWFFKTDKIGASKGARLAVIAAFLVVIGVGFGGPFSKQVAADREQEQILLDKGIHIPTEEEFAAAHENLPESSSVQPVEADQDETPAQSVDPAQDHPDVQPLEPAQNTESAAVVREVPADDESVIVYVTPYGQKYHESWCQTIMDSKKTEMTIEEAEEKNYKPCEVCHQN